VISEQQLVGEEILDAVYAVCDVLRLVREALNGCVRLQTSRDAAVEMWASSFFF
jgi:hypothetical protein